MATVGGMNGQRWADRPVACRMAGDRGRTVIDSLSMAAILLIGTGAPLLEGLSQTLNAVGHRTQFAFTLADAARLAASTAVPPLIVVVERSLAANEEELFRIPFSRGGALVLYGTEADPGSPLSVAVRRAALADLTLPLERNRLLALVQRVAERALITGRGPRHTPPEQSRFG